ncbi:MAG: HAD family phosphatase [Alistipes sp.]|nr:HAD family phosphatase [Candidatus Alistipes equi]
MIKNLVFDLGGILVDLSFSTSVDFFKPFSPKGLDVLLAEIDENHFFTRCQAGEFTTDELLSYIQQHCEKPITKQEIAYGWNLCLRQIPIERLRLIKELRSKYKVYMLSNICELHWDFIEKSFFDGQGIPASECFDELFLSYEMGMVKPNDEIYQALINRTGIIPSQTLYIDDLLPNIEAGRRAGFQTLLPEVSHMGDDGQMHMSKGEWSHSKEIISLL